MDVRRQTGVLGETAAAGFLESRGLYIIEKNYRCRYGEIDLIATDDWYLIVIEVKTRTGSNQGKAAEAVNVSKQRKICRTFNFYRMKHDLGDFVPVRFDVIEVNQYGHCHWIQNAFEYME